MGTYIVWIDGINRTNQLIKDGVSITQPTMGIRRCSVKLQSQLYSLGDELLVYVGEKLLFQGDIDKETISNNAEFIVYASDLLTVYHDKNARASGHFEYSSRLTGEDVGTGDNSETAFDLDYPARDGDGTTTDEEKQIEVFLDGALQAISDYTLDGDGGTDGVGLLTFDTAPDTDVIITANYFAIEPAEYSLILKDLMNYYYSGVFDLTNVDDTGMWCSHINLENKQLFECVREIAFRSKHVFWLVPPNYLYFKPKDSVSSGQEIVYGRDISSIKITRDTFTKTKVIINMQTGAVEAGAGERIFVFSSDIITTEKEGDDVADAILDELQDTRIRGEITLSDVRHNLYAGTTIILDAPEYGFEKETIPITQVQFSPLATKLTVGTTVAMIRNRIISDEERLKHMEARGLQWLFTCQSSSQTASGCTGPCEINCQHTCELSCELGACQSGICQTDCQLTEQVACVQTQQVCGTAGVCQANCEAGHGCELLCQSECQSNCQKGVCQTICELSCELACEVSCEYACVVTCELECQLACLTTCELACQNYCESSCQDGCQIKCQKTCESICQIGCEVSQMCCGTIIIVED